MAKGQNYDSLMIISEENEAKCKGIIQEYKILVDESFGLLEIEKNRLAIRKQIIKMNEQKIKSLKRQKVIILTGAVAILAGVLLIK